MLTTPHAAVGAAIASVIPVPVISLPLALLSHFAFDLVPHWNPHLDTQLKIHGRLTYPTRFLIAFDLLATFVFLGFLFIIHKPYFILLGSLLATLPDLLEAPHYFLNLKLPHIDRLIHHQRTHQYHIHILPGLLTQIIILLVSLYVIFTLSA